MINKKSDDITNNEWRYDIKRLKNFKIEEEHIENNDIKEFIHCVLNKNNKSVDDVIKCKKLAPDIKSIVVGDLRCSGKSDFTHLAFPELNIPFGEEEYAEGNIITATGDIEFNKETAKRNDEKLLITYIKRDTPNKVLCLLKRRKELYEGMSNSEIIIDAIEDKKFQRKTVLKEIVKFKNYIILRNNNKEK